MSEISKSHPDVATAYIKLDLTDNASVRQAALAINDRIESLDILINNAGGRETSIATAFLPHFLTLNGNT